ncbi:MAG: DUF6261 family protein [Tannerellaceae bacterium]|jgi:hypothetical protein|nr:DUF6261 family protein [Tannerellaceae bacterium]
MLKIEPFSTLLAKLSISNHYEFANNIKVRLEQEIANAPLLTAPWNKYIAAFNHEDDAYKHHKLFETQQLIQLDEWRLSILRLVFETIKVRLKSPTQAEHDAAELLNTEILHTYKNIRELDLESKTGDITNMIQDLQSNKLKNAVSDLHLQSLQNELVAANNAFISKFDERADDYQQQRIVGSASDARLATNEAFKALVIALQSIHESNELSTPNLSLRGVYEKCAFIINSTINHTKKTYSHKHGHDKDDDEWVGGGGIG